MKPSLVESLLPEQANTPTGSPPPADYRIQSAMVLFEFEKALGRYVTENIQNQADIPDSIRDGISARRKDTSVPNPTTVRSLVEETYIGEIIDIALASSQFRSDQPHLERLKKLVSDLDVFSIRNAVCHPNRPFPECYWHRTAAIATDPAVESLQLKSVSLVFRAACEGKLILPPESWFTQESWAVPSNLPDRFDHEITGLIDRNRDYAKLLKLLKNSRFSLIAFGLDQAAMARRHCA